MDPDHSQDLPPEILEKLRDLQLELDDGDITLKGFEKKKASLLANHSNSNPSSPISPSVTTVSASSAKNNSSTSQEQKHQQQQQAKSEAELLEELGPEPSAADVVDFLDFLPSPTHSPKRSPVVASTSQSAVQQPVSYQQQQQPAYQQASASPYLQYSPQQSHQQYAPQQQQQQYLLQQPAYFPQSQQQQYILPSAQTTRPNHMQYNPRPYPQAHHYGNVNSSGMIGRGLPPTSAVMMGSPVPTNSSRPYAIAPNGNCYVQSQPRPNGYYNQRLPAQPPPSNMMYRPAPQQQQQQQPLPNASSNVRPIYNVISNNSRLQPRPSINMGRPPSQLMQQQQQPQQYYGGYHSGSNMNGNNGSGNISRSMSTYNNPGVAGATNGYGHGGGKPRLQQEFDPQQAQQGHYMYSSRADSLDWNQQ